MVLEKHRKHALSINLCGHVIGSIEGIFCAFLGIAVGRRGGERDRSHRAVLQISVSKKCAASIIPKDRGHRFGNVNHYW